MEEQNVTAEQQTQQAQPSATPVENATPSQEATQASAESGVLTEELEQGQADAQSTAKETIDTQEKVDPEDQVPVDGVYKFFNEDGSEVSAEDAKGFQDAFKEAKLTSRQAKLMKSAYEKAVSEGLQKNVQELSNNWRRAVEQDAELGGANLSATKINLGRAIQTFGSPELREFLKESRLGNNPAMVRFINNVGKAVGEDRFIGGGSNASVRKDPVADAKRWFPNSPKLWGNN